MQPAAYLPVQIWAAVQYLSATTVEATLAAVTGVTGSFLVGTSTLPLFSVVLVPAGFWPFDSATAHSAAVCASGLIGL